MATEEDRAIHRESLADVQALGNGHRVDINMTNTVDFPFSGNALSQFETAGFSFILYTYGVGFGPQLTRFFSREDRDIAWGLELERLSEIEERAAEDDLKPTPLKVRERKTALFQKLPTDRYVVVLENPLKGGEWVVGLCGWDDTEWEAGRYFDTLPDALWRAANVIKWAEANEGVGI